MEEPISRKSFQDPVPPPFDTYLRYQADLYQYHREASQIFPSLSIEINLH
jgi:hypothetical protein